MADSNVEDHLSTYLLVVRCQVGDEEAFAKLYELFSEKTLRYLNGLLGDDAPDVQQELWLSVYRGIRNVGNPNAFRTWLFRTTRHRAIDFLLRTKRERELVDEASLEMLDASYEDQFELSDNVDGIQLEGALEAMPAVQREVLLLRYRDEMSYSEMALVIGCPIGTVRTRLYHAKRRMHFLNSISALSTPTAQL